MILDYPNYYEEVGIVIPTGYYEEVGIVIPTGAKGFQYSKIYPPINQTQTINLGEIVPPFKKPNTTDLRNALQFTFWDNLFFFALSIEGNCNYKVVAGTTVKLYHLQFSTISKVPESICM